MGESVYLLWNQVWNICYWTVQIFKLESAVAGPMAEVIPAPRWWELSVAHAWLCHLVGIYARSRRAPFPEDDIAPRGSNLLLLVDNMQGNPCALGACRFPSEVPRSGFHRDSLACL